MTFRNTIVHILIVNADYPVYEKEFTYTGKISQDNTIKESLATVKKTLGWKDFNGYHIYLKCHTEESSE